MVPNAYPASEDRIALTTTTIAATKILLAMYVPNRPTRHAVAKFSNWNPPLPLTESGCSAVYRINSIG